ncbi:MAG: aminoglycoside phosphotransferase family protein [Dorea sp.]|jgi:aminoglycoside phosphotransferase (APT) family kinase protein|nr:aminoglycoside phosphotransferase family protein [Dorea sp.]
MERIAGLREYVQKQEFKERIELPHSAELECRLLAQGEYNINYEFVHPIWKKKMILRVNTESQMHLEDQIGYEYHALKLLEASGRTPRAYYVDGSKEYLDYGVMVMEYLEGHALDYRNEMEYAAQCLGDIHSVPVTAASGLIMPQKPLQAILDECNEMAETYYNSPLGDMRKKKQIERMLKSGWRLLEGEYEYGGYRCCINTELNSGNFLINGEGKANYLIDWEKPLYGDPVQDLGHFLAPTTTFWKTDVILKQEEMDQFLCQYKNYVDGRYDVQGIEDRLRLFVPITCLRGITWCAMAWIQYQEPGRLIRNGSTFRKIEAYLEDGFLEKIETSFLA